MHELAVCQGLLSQVEAVAERHQADRVERIEIKWGPLSGVDVELLKRAFSIARIGGKAEEAEFIVKHLPIRVVCKVCGEETEVTSNKLICGICKNWQTRLVQGDEMLLSRVVLNKADTLNAQ